MRLRQAVLAARDLAHTKATLEANGRSDPFRDPGVKELGLDNAVSPVAIGLEVDGASIRLD